jgi:hypothetical protein
MSQSLATVKKNVRVSWQQDSNGQEKETVRRVTDLPHHESQFLLLVVGAPLCPCYFPILQRPMLIFIFRPGL